MNVIKSAIITLLCFGLCLAGCASAPTDGKKTVSKRGFSFSSVAKTDIDMVAEVHAQHAMEHLRTLTEKLYRRNPREWKKSGQPSVEAAVARIFDKTHDWNFAELGGRKGVESIYLAFQEDYTNDRVLAFMVGLTTMVIASYNDKLEFYVTDTLDAQKLYNCARNIEIASWKLRDNRNSLGELYLLSTSMDEANPNLSFEREFGTLIGLQDTMARIVVDKTNRQIKTMIQNVATAVFLPI